MAELLYNFLKSIGYHHPLHPALTHLPVGLAIAGFVFIILAYFIKHLSFDKTAKHCSVLALLTAIPTIVIGIFDWQLFFGAAYLFPIVMKMILASLLLILLIWLVFVSIKHEELMAKRVLVHFLCFLTVAGIGYFGGELVYGKKSSPPSPSDSKTAGEPSISAGLELFNRHCSACHFVDNTDYKAGPGLMGLFKMEALPVSEKPVTIDNIQQQFRSPLGNMPAFEAFSKEEMTRLIDYLKTL